MTVCQWVMLLALAATRSTIAAILQQSPFLIWLKPSELLRSMVATMPPCIVKVLQSQRIGVRAGLI